MPVYDGFKIEFLETITAVSNFVGSIKSVAVSDMPADQIVNLLMSSLSLVISLALLFIHLKNRKTQLNSYILSRSAFRSSSINLKYVSSEQLDDSILIKLVLFNPGSIATIIQSLTVYKEVESRFFIGRLLGFTEWREVREARWWPTTDSSCKTPKSMADEYKNLYVEDYRDILVSIPGLIDRNVYQFVIESNHGGLEHFSTIDSVTSYFPHAFRQWFHEK